MILNEIDVPRLVWLLADDPSRWAPRIGEQQHPGCERPKHKCFELDATIDISILTSQRFGLSCCVFIGVTWEGTNLTKETNLRYRKPATLRILVIVVKGTL